MVRSDAGEGDTGGAGDAGHTRDAGEGDVGASKSERPGQVPDNFIDVDAWFGRDGHPTIVEIGSGTGTSTAAMAPLEADTNIIAVEIYKPGLAKLLGAVVRGGIGNVRMVRGDGVEVLRHMIPDGSLTGVRIFFPDPWPKARHNKRRIIQSGTLNLIAQKLAPGGVLHAATDHADYAEWIAERAHVEPQLEYMGWPWPECPILTDRQVITKFEGKGLKAEHTITEFLWRKRDAHGAESVADTLGAAQGPQGAAQGAQGAHNAHGGND